jgi:hypothetical protein
MNGRRHPDYEIVIKTGEARDVVYEARSADFGWSLAGRD